jgi:hypothetical protein
MTAGPHALKVEADFDSPISLCRLGAVKDSRQFIVTTCNHNGICDQYEDSDSCIGDCWNPFNYDTSSIRMISVLGHDVEHLCSDEFCTVTDLSITCGNHIPHLKEVTI